MPPKRQGPQVSDDFKIVHGYKVKKVKTTLEKRLTEEEASGLLASITWETHKSYWRRNQAMIQFMLNTALRVGEVAGLKLSDVLTIGGKVKLVLDIRAEIAKRNKPRHVPLNTSAKDAVVVLVAENPDAELDSSLVVRKDGVGLSIRAIQHVVTKTALKAGVNRLVGPHVLRHTCLSELYDKTKNIKTVQTIAGHSKAQLTIDLYTHSTIDGLSKAMDTLDGEGDKDGN